MMPTTIDYRLNATNNEKSGKHNLRVVARKARSVITLEAAATPIQRRGRHDRDSILWKARAPVMIKKARSTSDDEEGATGICFRGRHDWYFSQWKAPPTVYNAEGTTKGFRGMHDRHLMRREVRPNIDQEEGTTKRR